jgi:hypothetical protein
MFNICTIEPIYPNRHSERKFFECVTDNHGSLEEIGKIANKRQTDEVTAAKELPKNRVGWIKRPHPAHVKKEKKTS